MQKLFGLSVQVPLLVPFLGILSRIPADSFFEIIRKLFRGLKYYTLLPYSLPLKDIIEVAGDYLRSKKG